MRDTARLIAEAVLDGFNKHYRIFREVGRAAKRHFELAEWSATQVSSRERIDFYDERVSECVERLENEFHANSISDLIWLQVKQHYITLMNNHKQPECAETFFNSVTCKILHRTYFNNSFIFVRPAVATDYMDADPPSYRCYYPEHDGLRATLKQIVSDFGLQRPFADLSRDIRNVLRAWRRQLPRPFELLPDYQIQMLGSLFYRNKGAYAVGKLINGSAEYPFVIPILHDKEGKLYLDTILLDQQLLMLLFSANRAYFLVDMEAPAAYVQFLRSLLPNKPKAELYTILGLQKHGKSLFYRDFLHHLRHSNDDFIVAPGIKGLVMTVFTLPSYPYVFKVIKDVFAPPKEVDRKTVIAKYLLVKHHDRVGRMSDTLEYSEVAFPKNRFSQELVDELRKQAPSSIEESGDTIIVKHLYVERRLIPLNIYLDHASDEQRRHAINEYGLALKQLAAANIFAGDLLFKNFGVTRYGRVVFYDYDELDYLTNCNFRKIPAPRNEEDEMSSTPWYTVGPHDIFPEEFDTFLLTDPKVRKIFLELHADLLDADYWKRIQDRIRAGHVEDVFPYPQAMRFQGKLAKAA
ncbi:MAG: bifunctional isocitrate dehydrogenase kinase/phosphatase [Burkholderiales bacterium]